MDERAEIRDAAAALNCVQAAGALPAIGSALRGAGWRRVTLIAGKQAFSAVSARLLSGLRDAEIKPEIELYDGGACAEDAARLAFSASSHGADVVLGVGGGCVLDVAKAVAALCGLPVACVPTIAATCAAVTPLSILHGAGGGESETRLHDKPVSAAFVDMDVIAAAPARYLAAGIAAAFAAAEVAEAEFMAAGGGLGDADSLPATLLACAQDAYDDAISHVVTDAMNTAVDCVIARAGAVTARFAGSTGTRPDLIRAISQVMRRLNGGRPSSWLYGETAAVGVLAQRAFRGGAQTETARLRATFKEIGLPVSLRELTMADTPREADALIRAICDAANLGEGDEARARDALRSVR